MQTFAVEIFLEITSGIYMRNEALEVDGGLLQYNSSDYSVLNFANYAKGQAA